MIDPAKPSTHVECQLCERAIAIPLWPVHVAEHHRGVYATGQFCELPNTLGFSPIIVCRRPNGHGGDCRSALRMLAWERPSVRDAKSEGPFDDVMMAAGMAPTVVGSASITYRPPETCEHGTGAASPSCPTCRMHRMEGTRGA